MGKKPQDDIQRRSHFRLRYPQEARITLTTDTQSFAVSEISEGGLRLVLHADAGLAALPDRIMGLLALHGETLAIEGRLLRNDGTEAVIALSEGIPLPMVLNEQRYLLRKYPGFYGKA